VHQNYEILIIKRTQIYKNRTKQSKTEQSRGIWEKKNR